MYKYKLRSYININLYTINNDSYKYKLSYHYNNFFFLFSPPAAYGSFQVRGQTGAAPASLSHSHSNAGSELHL